jgi:predicted acyl esterase
MRRAAAWPPAGSMPVVVELAAPSRALVADPATPAPTLGGSHLTVSAGMQDQRPLLARADVIELRGTALPAATLMAGAASAQIDVLEAGAGDIVVKLVDRRPDGEVRLLRESVAALSGPGTQRVDFAPLAYAFDAGSAPGLVLAGASLPAFVSQTPAGAGSVRVGGAQLVLPRLDE